MNAIRHKVIITGTGRAGTTFLVRLLTELGFDTGFDVQSWREHYYQHCDAGLELNPLDPGSPYIVKNPMLCDSLGEIVERDDIVIDHVFVPVRQVEAAALSRARIGGNVPGGLLKSNDPSNQKAVLALMFHRLVHTLVEHDVPHTFLHFPRLVLDADYTYDKLAFLSRAIEREKFRVVFARLSQPGLIHPFDGKNLATTSRAVTGEGQPARAYLKDERRRRLRRRLGRYAFWAASLAVAAFLGAHWSANAHTRPADSQVNVSATVPAHAP